jgi:hypothetical protein
MADKQPSFAERRERMAAIARDLVRISDEIHDEAERMAAAEKRFAARDRSTRNAKAGR